MATNIYYQNYFTLDNSPSNVFGVGISGSGVYKSAERDIDAEHIYGRNGDVLSDNGAFLNRIITYPCWIAHTFKTDFNTFRSFLMSKTDKYYELKDTYNPDFYFMARVVGPIDPEVLVMRRAGKFDVMFDCKPQWFLNSGKTEQTFSADGTITNPSLFASTPLLRIVGSGTVTLGTQEIVILNTCPYNTVYIDCESMDAYAYNNGAKVNCNNYVELPIKQVKLYTGGNAVDLSAGITTVGITPNWFKM